MLNDPERKEKEKKKLLKDYILLNEFNSVYDRMRELEEKFNQLSEEHKNVIKELETEIEELKENFKIEKESYQKQIDDLNKELSAKKKDLSFLNQKKNELTETTLNQGIELEKLQKMYENYKLDYNRIKEFVDQKCFILESLLTMYHIARFLFHPLHRRSMYTIYQLSNELYIKPKRSKKHYIFSLMENLSL